MNKYLQTGRSVKDVAEAMVIGESDMEKCKAQAAAEPQAGGAKAGEAKPTGHEGH